ncbi:MAG: YolD-like family protein [Eubacterium sp.]|nr:YolD-like family protein [Eubacterium sp.]
MNKEKEEPEVQNIMKSGSAVGKERSSFPYEDIVNLPHPVSRYHVPMPLIQRAAQFAPFAALTGYDEAIEETGRQTDDRVALSESEIAILNRKLQILEQILDRRPEVTITYFVPDLRKKGGSYHTVSGSLEKIDAQHQRIVMRSGEVISMGQLIGIEGDIPGDGFA